MASIYTIIFLSITLFGNEALSLMITHGLSYIIPLNNYFIIYFYYFSSFILIYFIIDYRIRQTDEVLIVEEVVDKGINKIVGLTLINTNGKISIFVENEKYVVFNHDIGYEKYHKGTNFF
ncbi:MAG: hypothetical protein ACOX4D_04535 [Bacteroidales bacterium]